MTTSCGLVAHASAAAKHATHCGHARLTTSHSLLDRSPAKDDRPQDKSFQQGRVVLRLTWHYVSSIKVDPYLNVDAGTMNPKEYAQTLATPPKY
jgi:hypothetical protein